MKRSNNQGFTLTELMVVVVIIGVLVAVAVPITNVAKYKAENNACIQNQRIIHTAAVQYLADNGVYHADVQVLVDNGYLQTMPHCKGEEYGEIDEGFAECPDDSHIAPE